MSQYVGRTLVFVVATALAAAALAIPAGGAPADDWPAVFDPSVLLTLNLSLDERDWDTIRRDTTNTIEVPATFWADGESPISVSVRRKSSRALPSESNPIKVGLKVDINEFVDGQTWRGLAKVSLENGADTGVVEEGFAYRMHNLASGPEGYGYTATYAAWVQVKVNGRNIGVYVNAEQRDKQALKNRDLWVSGKTWLYEQDGGGVILEEGDPDSPAVGHLCYSPFRPKGKSACPRPVDAALETDLLAWVDMQGMLGECAVDALTDNSDALCSHGKNSFFVDFSVDRMANENMRRLYLPWDLDTVFRNPSSNIYGLRSGRRLSQSAYESDILNHPTFRVQYNTIIRALTDPTAGALSESALHTSLDDSETLLAAALAADPYPANVGNDFGRLRLFVTARIASARDQVDANNKPPPR